MRANCVHQIKDRDNIPFSATDYSKFKFGCKTIAKQYGYELADWFINTLKFIPITEQIVVISSPFCFIPTATFAMKDYFVQRLNSYLVDQGLSPVQETKIHRTITYKEDYGELDAQQRLALIGKDGFHIDKAFVDGKVCLFLDDIKITGSHENVIKKMVIDNKLSITSIYLYYAQLDNKEIHPNIENFLNYSSVKCLLDLDKIIKNENFLLNTRVVKYILNSPHRDVINFIDYQPEILVQTIYDAAIGNSYHLIDDYKVNLTYIKNYLKTNSKNG